MQEHRVGTAGQALQIHPVAVINELQTKYGSDYSVLITGAAWKLQEAQTGDISDPFVGSAWNRRLC